MKIIYEPARFKVDSKKLLQAIKNQGNAFVAYTAQYSHVFKKTADSGMVLGCNVECIKGFKGKKILFVGDGVFHALMIKKEFIDKEIFVLNPKDYSLKEIRGDDVKKFINREAILLDKLRVCKKVGIIVCSKHGQERMNLAESIKKRLESRGKKAYLFLGENIDSSEFLNYSGLDLLVNTACPRLGLDDYTKFPIPIINHFLVLSEYLKD